MWQLLQTQFINPEVVSKLPKVTWQRSLESNPVKTDCRAPTNQYFITYMLNIYEFMNTIKHFKFTENQNVIPSLGTLFLSILPFKMAFLFNERV